MEDEKDQLDIELENLQRLNLVIENVISAMDASTENAERVNATVKNADKLLDLWIRVLAASDASQKLILDENWQGTSRDLQALEEEQTQASRRAQEQREAAERQQEESLARQRRAEEERARLDSQSSTTGRVARGRGQASARPTGVSRTGKKEVVSAYAQTARTKPSNPSNMTTREATAPGFAAELSIFSSGSQAAAGRGRGRGAPIVVRGTRASRGRQAGLGRSMSESAFK